MSKQEIREILKKRGPLTSADIGRYIDLGKSSVSTQIKGLKDLKEIYISGYEIKPDLVQGRNAPIYALGDQPDVIDLPRGKRAIAKLRNPPPDTRKNASTVIAEIKNQAGIWGGLVT